MHNPKRKIYYLTYNEAYSGVYQSQIIDVVTFLNAQFDVEVKLVAMVPIQKYATLKAEFKNKFSDIIVLPSFPKMKWWRMNRFIIQSKLQHADAIISRNPIATNIALELRRNRFCKKVCADIRGAFAAEFKEYLTKNNELIYLARTLETTAVEESNYRLFVTNMLLKYYRNISNYEKDEHVIIPTTLDNSFKRALPNMLEIEALRKKLNIPNESVVIVFSGGNADWQSFELIDTFFHQQLSVNPNSFVLILSKTDISNWKSMKSFPNRIKQAFVAPDEVFQWLSLCDYGLLLREESITNQVASPTKCAEYLAAGLPVIISKNIGDYSAVVHAQNLGMIYDGNEVELNRVTEIEKLRMQKFATENYFKDSAENQLNYKALIDSLSS